MKRMVWLLLLAAVLRMSGILPFTGTEVADLLPVETLTVSLEQNQVIVDGGSCRGRGTDWESALRDLHHGAEGTVFLGTAEQVVFTEAAAELLPQVVESKALRPGAVVCVCVGEPPTVEEVTAYLSAHDAGTTVQKVQALLLQKEEIRLPLLVRKEGGLRLYGT